MNNRPPLSRLFRSDTVLFLAALFAFAYVTLVFNLIAGLVELFICAGLAVYNVWHRARREKEITEYVEDLTFHTDYTSKDSLLRFPLPLTVVQMDGTIIWYNEHFEDIFADKKLFDKRLSDIAGRAVDIPALVENKSPSGAELELNGKHYRVLTNVVKTGSSELFAVLYWLDQTELVNLRRENANSRIVVCIIMIDNYEDVMQSVEEDVKSLLVANIERKLSDWAGSSGGVLKKIERDKYLYMFEYRYLDRYIEKKFDILDTIREIKVGGHMPATISIGIGMGGDSISANDAYARSAIDMALGRGGDQVVIKDADRFVFYGGKSKELEKRTRVRARVVAFAIKELINQAENVIIMGHTNADLDSLGAALGLYAASVHKNKITHIVLEDATKTAEKLLKKVAASYKLDNVFITRSQAKELTGKNTLLLIVDVFRQSLVECPELLSKTDNIVVIDHHRKHAEFIENAVLIYHEPFASSACEMVTELLQYIEEGLTLPPVIAEALYSGIALDTKSFTFKTGIRTFEAAAFLRRMGANITETKQLFQLGPDVYAKRAEIVKSAKIYREGIAIAVFSGQHADVQTLCAQGADELLNIDGVMASFVICAVDNSAYISGRSLGTVNVQVILEKLGGGGHITIAAAQLKGIEPAEAEKSLKGAIDEYLEENIR